MGKRNLARQLQKAGVTEAYLNVASELRVMARGMADLHKRVTELERAARPVQQKPRLIDPTSGHRI